MNQAIQEPKPAKLALVSLLFFLSGSAALIYEVLWMKELSLLFGNSAQAAAATLAAFFTGIAAGNAFWGRRAKKIKRPLFVYGVLELCITLSATLYFAIYLAYDSLYPVLFSLFENAPGLLTSTKFILALLLFFPAAFFMGGTLPIMTQHFVRNKNTLGKRASVLYAINTFGAASGSLAAGFYLPQAFGIDASYLMAMAATLSVGVIAIWLGYRSTINSSDSASVQQLGENSAEHEQPALSLTYLVLAGLSGFASLALQVLWIRMFAQVLHNSVYSYAAILASFLIALACGGAIARILSQRQLVSSWVLPSLLTLTAVLVAASPTLFYYLTDSSSYIGGRADFLGYVLQIFFVVALVIGIPTLVMGILLPYLFKLVETDRASPGELVGRLVTVNTLGAIAGSIIAGFVLLDWIGLWTSIKVVAMLYLSAAFWLLLDSPDQRLIGKFAPIAGMLLLVTALDTSKLPIVKIDPIGKQETLLKVWEGADATVAVVRRNGFLRTKLNNWYTLGSTGDMTTQQMQTHLPMLLHPEPKRVFYLGLGTGITAGTALDYEVEEVIVSELAPSAIKASKEFFTEHTNGLFTDSRVRVIAEDGRNVLRGSDHQYDLIISDLFIPWKAGTGTLYSVEHYQTALKRLNSGGMYAQWLPLYQLSQEEFKIIARSMLEVFPMVSLWRGNFKADRAVMALMGHQSSTALSPQTPLLQASKFALQEWLAEDADTVPLIAHYSGTLEIDDKRLASASLNTDNNPIIEYLAPINHRLEKAGQLKWFLDEQLFEFTGPYLHRGALKADSYLAQLDPDWLEVIQAGYYLNVSYMLADQDHQDASKAEDTYISLLRKAAVSLQREPRR